MAAENNEKKRLLWALQAEANNAKQEIEALKSRRDASTRVMAGGTRGALSGAARSSVQHEIEAFTRQIAKIEKRVAWHNEMLKKYGS